MTTGIKRGDQVILLGGDLKDDIGSPICRGTSGVVLEVYGEDEAYGIKLRRGATVVMATVRAERVFRP